jgi:2-hydroxychromene-2-carboxylate isomerase
VREIKFYYDYASPFAYLGATQIERVAAAHGATVAWRPMLLGALFKAIGTPIVPISTFNEAKRSYYQRDLHDWAEYWGAPFRWPTRFPMRTVDALRIALAVDGAERVRLSLALFHAYWVEDRDLADRAVLAEIVDGAGLDRGLVERSGEQKGALIAITDEAIAAGVCGAPSFIVGPHLFWGQDRLQLVERVLDGWDPPTEI